MAYEDAMNFQIALLNYFRGATMTDEAALSAEDQARLVALAEPASNAWTAYVKQQDAQISKGLGTTYSAQQVETRYFIALGNAHGAAIAELHPEQQALIWQFWGEVFEGYLVQIKELAREEVAVQMEATMQREDQLRAVIQELSTPIIPIFSGVLVLPLVGAIDTMRSQEITERLLEEIVRQQADIVIIDITGVSVVDTSVANHLIMTAQAVNLLGSKVIFTGISSTIAQTIVQLGVNLGDVVTLSNLQAAMSYALEQLGLEITELQTH